MDSVCEDLLDVARPRADKFEEERDKLAGIAAKAEEWAGIPMPIDGESLIVNPTYRFAAILNHEEPSIAPARAIFWSSRFRCNVVIDDHHGKVRHGLAPAFHSVDQQLRTLGCSVAWGIEQEATALELLSTMIAPHTMKMYCLTGSFIETSKRSGVIYVFRKLRPTIALRATPDDRLKILCSMCMHPIAYYQGSWAGAMCPTDDVIAHLSMMRADEPMFWRRCNQHPPHRPEAGL